MRILIVHNQYTEPGGEDKIIEAEQSLLTSHGHDVELYLRSNNELKRKSIFRKLKFVYLEVFSSKKTYYDVLDMINAFGPDIVHVHNIFLMISPAIYDVCFQKKIPVVQTIHNYRFFCSNGLFFREGRVCEDCISKGPISAITYRCWRRSMLASGLMTKVQDKLHREYLNSDKISRYIAPSEFTRKKCVECGLPEDKIAVKPHFSPDKPFENKSPGEYVAFVGRLIDYKGIILLLECFKDLKDIPLKIIGDGPLHADVERVAADNPQISFLGYRSSEQVGELLSKAAYIVCPSPCYETFGRVVVEAFSQGTPALVSRGGALEELITDPCLGVIAEDNQPQYFRSAAKDLWLNVQRGGVDFQKIRDIYDRRYTADINYKMMMSIYTSSIK